MYEIKRGAKTNHKRRKIESKTKTNTIGRNLRLILSKGLEKLQRYATSKK